MDILVPVDGSVRANCAVDYVINYASQLKVSPRIHLLNVQLNVASGNVKLLINQATINDYYREQGIAALANARGMLDKAGMEYSYHISVGSPAEAVVRYAQDHRIDQIVMSANGGDSTLSHFLLGSVVSKVIQLAQTPVLLVKN